MRSNTDAVTYQKILKNSNINTRSYPVTSYESRYSNKVQTTNTERQPVTLIESKNLESKNNKSCRGNVRALDGQYYMKQKNRNCGKQQKQSNVIKTIVYNLNLEYVKPQRAGIIIYTIHDGSVYFGLGLDSNTHDLTDFGGRVFYKFDQNVIRGALREFEEETLGIFDTISHDDIKNCPVIYDDNNLIIFVHLDIDPNDISETFNNKYRETIEQLHIEMQRLNNYKYREPEVCGITWLSWEDFQRSIKEKGIMFSRVQRFLNRADDFSYLL